MSSASLWGEIPTVEAIKPPVTILREQASILSNETKHILEGKVEPERSPRFVYNLSIVAPALDHYSFGVLRITHGLDLYPVDVEWIDSRGWSIKCDNEQAFISALQSVLSSERVRKAIASLLAQSKAVA